ncbi:hypothetical protein HaLaN_32606, partial [Haematococcus lacustris]
GSRQSGRQGSRQSRGSIQGKAAGRAAAPLVRPAPASSQPAEISGHPEMTSGPSAGLPVTASPGCQLVGCAASCSADAALTHGAVDGAGDVGVQAGVRRVLARAAGRGDRGRGGVGGWGAAGTSGGVGGGQGCVLNGQDGRDLVHQALGHHVRAAARATVAGLGVLPALMCALSGTACLKGSHDSRVNLTRVVVEAVSAAAAPQTQGLPRWVCRAVTLDLLAVTHQGTGTRPGPQATAR